MLTRAHLIIPMTFLKEYWLWIVAPIALVLIALAVLMWMGQGSDSPFVYNIN